jgi:hypothetical protein
VLILERDTQLGAVCKFATLPEADVLLDDLGHSKVANTLTGRSNRDGCCVLP